jgi:hypothetical protein
LVLGSGFQVVFYLAVTSHNLARLQRGCSKMSFSYKSLIILCKFSSVVRIIENQCQSFVFVLLYPSLKILRLLSAVLFGRLPNLYW